MKSLTQIDETISHLRILEKLEVGMGAVYKAENTPPLLRHPEILAWRRSIRSI
jgi:hypothetical protein